MGERTTGRLGLVASGLLLGMTCACGQSEAPNEPAAETGGATNPGGTGGGGGSSGASSETGGSNAGVGGSASGAGGSAGRDGECPNIEVADEPGIVLHLGGETIAFRENLLWYDGRPPTLDLIAETDDPDWTSFRIFIDPDGDGVVPGVYQSGPGNVTYVQARRALAEYDSIDNDASTLCVTEAGSGAGARVAGTFVATLVNADGSVSLETSGTFSGVLGE